MDTAPFVRCLAHPDVVEVGDQHPEGRHEFTAVGGPRRQQGSVHNVPQLEGAGCDVTGVDDAVVAEQRRMRIGRRDGGWVA